MTCPASSSTSNACSSTALSSSLMSLILVNSTGKQTPDWKRTPQLSSPLSESPTPSTVSTPPSSLYKRKKRKEPFSVKLLKRLLFRTVELPDLDSVEEMWLLDYTQHGRVQAGENYMYRNTCLARKEPIARARTFPLGEESYKDYTENPVWLYGERLYLRMHYPAMYEVLYGPLTRVYFAGLMEDGRTVVYGVMEGNEQLSVFHTSETLCLASLIDPNVWEPPSAGYRHQDTLVVEVACFHSVPISSFVLESEFTEQEQAAELDRLLAAITEADHLEQSAQPMTNAMGTAVGNNAVSLYEEIQLSEQSMSPQPVETENDKQPQENQGEVVVPGVSEGSLPPSTEDDYDPLREILQDGTMPETQWNSAGSVAPQLADDFSSMNNNVLEFELSEEEKQILDAMFSDFISEDSQDTPQDHAAQSTREDVSELQPELRPAKRRSLAEDEPQPARRMRFNQD